MRLTTQIPVAYLKVGDLVEVDRGEPEEAIVSIVNHVRWPEVNQRTAKFESGKERDYCYGKTVTGIRS